MIVSRRRAPYKSLVVDIITETTIARPRADVAAFVTDPDNAPRWYVNIKSVEWRTPKPLAVGAHIAFVAQFLGRRLAYTYEVSEWIPGERFVMRTAEGPFPMETSYLWRDSDVDGRAGPLAGRHSVAAGRCTHMTLRNRGTPSGFSKLVAPLMASQMRRANEKDLAKLRALLEQANA